MTCCHTRYATLTVMLIGSVTTSAVAQRAWTVDAQAVIDIKGPAVATAFLSPVGAVRLSNGTIIVADPVPGGGNVHFIASTGKLLRTAGKPGDGTGEFRYIGWIGHCSGDSVFVWDLRHRKMTVFDKLGIAIREYRIPAEGSTEPPPVKVSCAQNGAIAYQPTTRILRSGATNVLVRGSAPITIEGGRGRSRAVTGAIAGDEEILLGGNVWRRPFGKSTSFALASDRLYVGTADSASIDVYGLDGRRMPSLTLHLPPQPLTPAMYRRATEDIVAQAVPPVRDTIRKTFAGLPLPDRAAPYRNLLVDPDDLLWFTVITPGGASTQLRALDKSGRVAGEVRLPVAMQVTAIGRDFILGTYVDGARVQHVRMYRLRRGA